MSDIDGKGISQLLFSPLFLLNHILGNIVPGSLLILLVALKGNVLLRSGWLSPIFGYKTKVAIFLMLAFVIGSILRLPLHWIASLLKPLTAKYHPDKIILKGTTQGVQEIIGMAIVDGVFITRPAVMDRLALFQADAAFHMGTGTALLIASFVPGDGSLRWIEGILGLGMYVSGFLKAREYNKLQVSLVGAGLIDILGGMTPQQIDLAKAAIKAFGLGTIGTEVPQPIVTTSSTPVPETPMEPPRSS
jgi:hypothetical protein